MYLKLSSILGGLLLWVGCGSSESAEAGAANKVGPSAAEIFDEQKSIAEYYKISYKAQFVTNKSTGKIEQLLLSNASLTDLGADRISKLTDLITLNLVNTKITDNGLKHISKLSNLRKLELARNNITDAGVEHLLGLKKLEKLNISYTRVGDAGLVKLAEVTSLTFLDVRRSRVTGRGRDRFEKTPMGRKRGFRLQH
tara:strand:- start:16 stop:606 length:591 start_codon:yes stop_codon:yes gene_type:complete